MRTLLLTAAVASIATAASAYDFLANGIAYDINADGKTVTVTYTKYSDNYAGTTAVAIPERVANGGKEYRVTAIGDYAFNDCKSLVSLSVSTSVTAIGEYAAFGCSRLSMLTLGANVTSIGRYAFAESAITTLKLPASVKTLGSYAFSSCAGLVSAVLGNGVEKVGVSCFRNCLSMVSLSMGVNVSAIGNTAFAGCGNLSTITCGMVTPPAIADDVFQGVSRQTCRLYVPSGSVGQYRDADVWSTFDNILSTSLDYAIEATGVDYLRGTRNVKLTLGLTNSESVSAVRLLLLLPEGMTLATHDDEFEALLDTNRGTRNHTLTVSLEDEVYTILVSSPTNALLKGNSGALMHLTIEVNDSLMVPDEIWVADITVAGSQGQVTRVPDKGINVDVYYLRGDADGDATVDVADYQTLALELLSRGSSKRFFLDAADVNQSGDIDVGDLVGIVQRGLNIVYPERVKM